MLLPYPSQTELASLRWFYDTLGPIRHWRRKYSQTLGNHMIKHKISFSMSPDEWELFYARPFGDNTDGNRHAINVRSMLHYGLLPAIKIEEDLHPSVSPQEAQIRGENLGNQLLRSSSLFDPINGVTASLGIGADPMRAYVECRFSRDKKLIITGKIQNNPTLDPRGFRMLCRYAAIKNFGVIDQQFRVDLIDGVGKCLIQLDHELKRVNAIRKLADLVAPLMHDQGYREFVQEMDATHPKLSAHWYGMSLAMATKWISSVEAIYPRLAIRPLSGDTPAVGRHLTL